MRPGRISSLDGMRAISILFVFLGHFFPEVGESRGWAVNIAFANFGVRVFFVISGYLITRLLLEERDASGTISLKNFYARRSIRIFPAAYTYLAIALPIYWHSLSRVNIITALTYTQNYSIHKQWAVSHLWSLAVEEQFYLLWPFLLRRFFKYRQTILWTVVCIVPFVNLPLAYYKSTLWGRSFFSVADALAVGCLLAIWKHDKNPVVDRIVESKFAWLIPVFAVGSASALLMPVPPALSLFRILIWRPANHFAIAFSLDHAIRRKYWLLNTGPMVWVGTLSYSLYLWHQMFSNPEINYWAGRFPQNMVFTLGAAMACHYLVEKPMLKLRKRFKRPEARPALETATR